MVNPGFKASETLLGIETPFEALGVGDEYEAGFKASETLLGIETLHALCSEILATPECFKASETLLGIETGSAKSGLYQLLLQSL